MLSSVLGNTKWSASAVGGSFCIQDMRGASRRWCWVLRSSLHTELHWVSTCLMLFYLHLNWSIYQGLLQDIKVWLKIQTWFLITLIFWFCCNRTDLPLPKTTQHSGSYKHFPWTHFLSPSKTLSQFFGSKVPFSQMKGTQTEFGLRRCWKGVGKGCWMPGRSESSPTEGHLVSKNQSGAT